MIGFRMIKFEVTKAESWSLSRHRREQFDLRLIADC